MVLDKGIKVSLETKQKLNDNKIYKRETYDNIIERLIKNNQKEVKDGR